MPSTSVECSTNDGQYRSLLKQSLLKSKQSPLKILSGKVANEWTAGQM